MSAATRIPLRARPRRSHAERTAETRARIIAAVVESIAEVGFQNTTAAEIVRRAGLTWGAVQHHFGGKDGILLAVLESSFDHFVSCLGKIETRGHTLDERADLFIERAWRHFGSRKYRSTFEILLYFAGSAEEEPGSIWQNEIFRAWNRIWAEIFPDVAISRRRTAVLQHYTISVLSGLATTQMLGMRGLRSNSAPLGLLKKTLASELSAAER